LFRSERAIWPATGQRAPLAIRNKPNFLNPCVFHFVSPGENLMAVLSAFIWKRAISAFTQ
jgi:hypothetical protein